MFSDPLAITYAAVAKSLARVGSGANESTYLVVDSSNVTYQMLLNHRFPELGKPGRNRCVARLTRAALVPDPLVSSQNRPESLTVTITGDWSGIHTPADIQALYAALLTFLSTANFLKLAGGET
jgi:hypothetical protein